MPSAAARFPALDRRSDRRHQELRPRRSGLGDAARAGRGRRGHGRRRLGAGARPPLVGGARRPERSGHDRAGASAAAPAGLGDPGAGRCPAVLRRDGGVAPGRAARGAARAERRAAGARAASATSGATCWWPRERSRSRLDPEVSLWDLAAPLVDRAGGRRPLHRPRRRATADGGNGIATNGRCTRPRWRSSAADGRAAGTPPEPRSYSAHGAAVRQEDPRPPAPARADASATIPRRWRPGCARRRSTTSSARSGCWRRGRRCAARSRRGTRTR